MRRWRSWSRCPQCSPGTITAGCDCLRGGRRLSAVQRRLAPEHGKVGSNLANAAVIWRRVQSGEFGPEAKRLLGQCFVVIIVWVVVLAIWFGILLYAEERVKAQGGWPDTAQETESAPMTPQ